MWDLSVLNFSHFYLFLHHCVTVCGLSPSKSVLLHGGSPFCGAMNLSSEKPIFEVNYCSVL